MNILEQIIASIAPHKCVACGLEGGLLCRACQNASLIPVPSRCYRCHKVTKQNSTCKSCKSVAKIDHVWVSARYESAAKDIIYRLKFARAQAGAKPLAGSIAKAVPDLPKNTLVSHIPTARSRVRARGYDQAELIAKELCKLRGWRYRPLLKRSGKTRQVGAGRQERFRHLKQALSLSKASDLNGEHVLLVDDITTSGATLETAAKILKNAGAATVDAAVFAQA